MSAVESISILRVLLPLALLFFLVDIPWLFTTSVWAQPMFKRIQGGTPVQIRWAVVPIVYIALAFLLSRAASDLEAFLTGLATYAVYDFTNYATLAKYEAQFAIADTLWGGILFYAVRRLSTTLGLL